MEAITIGNSKSGILNRETNLGIFNKEFLHGEPLIRNPFQESLVRNSLMGDLNMKSLRISPYLRVPYERVLTKDCY